mgnify:CR=1 FL=1|tara:strand:- start:523 stop:1458 length:936 start_codon:yes stop_codon:yes gene_type:complete
MINKIFNKNLLNHTDHLNFFIKLYLNKKLPQTFLIKGEKGIGKLNFAFHFVNFILSQHEENKYEIKSYKINSNNKTFKLLSENIHPNFFLISPNENRKNIDILQIKKMQNFLNMSSFNNMPKIILINDCEYLNLSSSNALLKSLEEKYDNVFFILILDIKKTLLSTIKSRCVQFKFLLKNNERIDKINELLDNQYDLLSPDFKDKYLNLSFYKDLLDYCKKNKLELQNINLYNLLTNIFASQNYKKNEFLINNLFSLIQLFLHKRIIDNININKNFSYLKYFTKRFDDINKYNLDFESYVLEFKYLIYNEK